MNTYVEQWTHLVDLSDRYDFPYVGDSELVTKNNMAYIHEHEEYFIAPAPMYESYEQAF